MEVTEYKTFDKVDYVAMKLSEQGDYKNISNSDKADIFGFDIADVSGSIRLFSDVMKTLEIRCGIGERKVKHTYNGILSI